VGVVAEGRRQRAARNPVIARDRETKNLPLICTDDTDQKSGSRGKMGDRGELIPLSPVFRRLQSNHVRANAVGFSAAGGEAISLVIFLADSR
jgi:hypothetical protein